MYCTTCELIIDFPNICIAQIHIGGQHEDIYFTCFNCLVTKHETQAAVIFNYLRGVYEKPSAQ